MYSESKYEVSVAVYFLLFNPWSFPFFGRQGNKTPGLFLYDLMGGGSDLQNARKAHLCN
jgi:hypothetical protein